MSEGIVLDPSAVATGRTELVLHAIGGPITVRGEGPDWGDAEIAAHMAKGERGEVPVDFDVPNRKVTIPLTLHGTDFATARRQLQQKVALFQQEGGWLKRSMDDGSVLYLDVVNATLSMGGGTAQALQDVDMDVDLLLEAIPDFYGDQITLDLITENTLPEVAQKLKQGGTDAVIKGDYPGRVAITVTDTQGIDQNGILWAFRCRHYSSASTAALSYEAEALQPLDSAATAARTGASGTGSNTVTHTNLLTRWTPVVGTNIGGTTFLTHTGTYQVWARVVTGALGTQVRFVYDVGDLTLPEENDPVTVPWAYDGYDLNLGTIRLDPAPVGTHRWQGQIQAKAATAGDDIWVDRIWLQPIDESAGRVVAPATFTEGLSGEVARDAFDHAAGNLAGKVLPLGGTWAAGTGSDTDDFTVNATDHVAQRATVSDTTYRWEQAGSTNYASVAVEADVKISALSSAFAGVYARWVDASNWFGVGIGLDGGGVSAFVLETGPVVLSGSVGGYVRRVTSGSGADVWITVRLAITSSGTWVIWGYERGYPNPTPIAYGYDAALATGGVLATGKVGLLDRNTSATAATRSYDNFRVLPATLDAAVFPNQSARLGTDGMYREDSTGTSAGPISHVIGGLPRIPPSGMEGRPVELFVKPSRGDFDERPDGGIDNFTVQVAYRPSYLFASSA